MLRAILAVIGGLVLSNLIVFAAETADGLIFPAAAAVPDGKDPAAYAAFMARLPIAALIAVVLGWTVASAAGAFFAARVGRRGEWPGRVFTVLFLAVVVTNFVLIPHPLWMIVAGLVLVALAGWLGARVGTGRQVAPG